MPAAKVTVAGGRRVLDPFDLMDPPDLPGPFIEVDESYWPEDIEHVPDAQMQKLADALKPLIARTLPDTLRAMKLAQ